MKREEAMRHVGHQVVVMTAANGIYTGRLKLVTREPGQPWRGMVLIDGVLEVALHSEGGRACRRGHRPGEHIEAGGCNIFPADGQGNPSYEDALLDRIARVRTELEECKDRRLREQLLAGGKCYQEALAAERRRVNGDVWRICQPGEMASGLQRQTGARA